MSLYGTHGQVDNYGTISGANNGVVLGTALGPWSTLAAGSKGWPASAWTCGPAARS